MMKHDNYRPDVIKFRYTFRKKKKNKWIAFNYSAANDLHWEGKRNFAPTEARLLHQIADALFVQLKYLNLSSRTQKINMYKYMVSDRFMAVICLRHINDTESDGAGWIFFPNRLLGPIPVMPSPHWGRSMVVASQVVRMQMCSLFYAQNTLVLLLLFVWFFSAFNPTCTTKCTQTSFSSKRSHQINVLFIIWFSCKCISIVVFKTFLFQF